MQNCIFAAVEGLGIIFSLVFFWSCRLKRNPQHAGISSEEKHVIKKKVLRGHNAEGGLAALPISTSNTAPSSLGNRAPCRFSTGARSRGEGS